MLKERCSCNLIQTSAVKYTVQQSWQALVPMHCRAIAEWKEDSEAARPVLVQSCPPPPDSWERSKFRLNFVLYNTIWSNETYISALLDTILQFCEKISFQENLQFLWISPPQSISDYEMAGLKVFLALCCVAAVSAVQLERKPFKRLIPADVLRGRFDQCSWCLVGLGSTELSWFCIISLVWQWFLPNMLGLTISH